MLNSTFHAKLIVLRDSVCHFIDVRARHPLATGYERWAVTEQLIHVFKVEAFGFGLEAPEEDGVEEVADHEDEVEFLSKVSASLRDWNDAMVTHPSN